MGPSFLHTFIAFWLDFQGLGLPGGFKKQEKTAPGKSCFWEFVWKAPQIIFLLFLVDFGVPFWSFLATPNHIINFQVAGLCPEVLRGRFGTTFGFHFQVFLTNVGNTFGVILEMCFEKNVILLAWQLVFRKFKFMYWFVCCWRAFPKIAVSAAWELSSREFAWACWCLFLLPK